MSVQKNIHVIKTVSKVVVFSQPAAVTDKWNMAHLSAEVIIFLQKDLLQPVLKSPPRRLITDGFVLLLLHGKGESCHSSLLEAVSKGMLTYNSTPLTL